VWGRRARSGALLGVALVSLYLLLPSLLAVFASWRAAAQLLALIPLTPGGVGFVEAGLVGTLTLAGVSGGDALASTLLYRLVAYWLPLPAGAVAYLLFRRRYGHG
jgi:uncharacterized protein (TIRG00374 family)